MGAAYHIEQTPECPLCSKVLEDMKVDATKILNTIKQFNKPEKLNEEQQAVIRLCEFILEL